MKYKVRYDARVEPRDETIEAERYYEEGAWFVFQGDDGATTFPVARIRQASVVRIDVV